METMRPEYRYKLKGAIIARGYKSASEFGKVNQMADAYLNSIINAWRYPSPLMQQKICKGLGVSSKELRELL